MISRAELDAPLNATSPSPSAGLRRAMIELARQVRRGNAVALLIDRCRGDRRGSWTPYAALGIEVRLLGELNQCVGLPGRRVELEVFKNPWKPGYVRLEANIFFSGGEDTPPSPGAGASP
jgi:hypothetical protein